MDAPAEESSGTSENTWIMGGRFVQQMTTGTAMGQPFEGMGFFGYDNMKGEYTNLWLDNMSTGIMKSSSKYDAGTKSFSEEGSFPCPMTGETDRKFRGSMKVIDNDHLLYEMYSNDPASGKEFKSMEISYARVK